MMSMPRRWCSLLLFLLPAASAFFVGPNANAAIPLREMARRAAAASATTTTTTVAENGEIPAIPTEWRGEVLKTLSSVIDPDLNRDIVTLGFVQNLKLEDRLVSFDVELTTPACPIKDQFAADCQRLVMDLPWTEDVHVKMTAQASVMDTDTIGMAKIGAVIAVSSCKGGVGKSTTSVNLAYALQKQGASVGIFDADVYGPSLPTMVRPDDDIVRFVGRQISPLQRNGVRLMSFGYVNEGSAVMRGPMITQLLDQFLSVTYWGSLDYLILDMPPGTGDIQLTLTQRLNITAAVIVTTPQELSFADVVRGVEMFDSVNVPCVAVVENMAYYQVEEEEEEISQQPPIDEQALRNAFVEKLKNEVISLGSDSTVCGLAEDLVQMVMKNSSPAAAEPASSNNQKKKEKKKVQIFGPGHRERLAGQYGIEHTFSLPLMDKIAENGDSGTPYVLQYPDSPTAEVFSDLATTVVSEVAKSKFSGNQRPSISYVESEHMIRVNEDTITPAELRRACRCASCVEEFTGRQLLKPSDVSEKIQPLRMYPTGQYALSVDWSDGHRSLYPYRQIMAVIEEYKEEQRRANEQASTALQQETLATTTTTTTTTASTTGESSCSCCDPTDPSGEQVLGPESSKERRISPFERRISPFQKMHEKEEQQRAKEQIAAAIQQEKLVEKQLQQEIVTKKVIEATTTTTSATDESSCSCCDPTDPSGEQVLGPESSKERRISPFERRISPFQTMHEKEEILQEN